MLHNLAEYSLAALLDTLPHPIFLKSADARFVYVNREYERMFGVSKEDVIGKTVLDLEYLPLDARRQYQIEDEKLIRTGKSSHHLFDYLFSDGKIHNCLYWSNGFCQEDGTRGLVGLIVDITHQKRCERRLQRVVAKIQKEKALIEKDSERDFLTGLYNRKYLETFLQQEVKSAQGLHRDFSCIMIDVDNFKDINDKYGHDVGDIVLKRVSAALLEACRKTDIVGRHGGDEFFILLPMADRKRASLIAERLREGVFCCTVDGCNLCITISVGVSSYQKGDCAASLRKRADDALYEAKQSGRNRVCFL